MEKPTIQQATNRFWEPLFTWEFHLLGLWDGVRGRVFEMSCYNFAFSSQRTRVTILMEDQKDVMVLDLKVTPIVISPQ